MRTRLQWIFKEYRIRFFSEFKEAMASHTEFVSVYICILLYHARYMDRHSPNLQTQIWFLLVAVMMILCVLMSMVYTNRLGKFMYLCPLSRAQREAYIKTAYWLRIVVCMVLFLIFDGIYLIFFQKTDMLLLFFFKECALFGTLMTIHLGVRGVNLSTGKRNDKKHWNKLEVVQTIELIIMVILNASVYVETKPLTRGSLVFYVLTISLITIGAVVSFVRYKDSTMEVALNYELAYGSRELSESEK